MSQSNTTNNSKTSTLKDHDGQTSSAAKIWASFAVQRGSKKVLDRKIVSPSIVPAPKNDDGHNSSSAKIWASFTAQRAFSEKAQDPKKVSTPITPTPKIHNGHTSYAAKIWASFAAKRASEETQNHKTKSASANAKTPPPKSEAKSSDWVRDLTPKEIALHKQQLEKAYKSIEAERKARGRSGKNAWD